MPDNLCCACGPGLSRCGAATDADRQVCEFYFPAGPYDDGCMYHRSDMDGACDNANAQHGARNKGA